MQHRIEEGKIYRLGTVCFMVDCILKETVDSMQLSVIVLDTTKGNRNSVMTVSKDKLRELISIGDIPFIF